METRNRLTVTRGEGGGEQGWEEGGGTRQGACMSDPWTWTTGWGMTVGAGGRLGRGGQRGKIGTTVTE